LCVEAHKLFFCKWLIMKAKSVIKLYVQPAFLICVTVLAISAVGMPILIQGLGGYLKKEPLPLKKSLDFLDENTLGSYKVFSKTKIPYEEVIESLGTEDYIQWILEDTQVPVESPVRKCLLFITYYERPDMVPHVPEECYVGGGNQLLDKKSLSLEIVIKGSKKEIPVRYLVFGSKEENLLSAEVRYPVLYFINVDGLYANSRDSARSILSKNFFRKYSYFSKVELGFFNNTDFGKRFYPSQQEALSASQKLLGVILPILEERHWPDIEGQVISRSDLMFNNTNARLDYGSKKTE